MFLSITFVARTVGSATTAPMMMNDLTFTRTTLVGPSLVTFAVAATLVYDVGEGEETRRS